VSTNFQENVGWADYFLSPTSKNYTPKAWNTKALGDLTLPGGFLAKKDRDQLAVCFWLR